MVFDLYLNKAVTSKTAFFKRTYNVFIAQTFQLGMFLKFQRAILIETFYMIRKLSQCLAR